MCFPSSLFLSPSLTFTFYLSLSLTLPPPQGFTLSLFLTYSYSSTMYFSLSHAHFPLLLSSFKSLLHGLSPTICGLVALHGSWRLLSLSPYPWFCALSLLLVCKSSYFLPACLLFSPSPLCLSLSFIPPVCLSLYRSSFSNFSPLCVFLYILLWLSNFKS